MSTDCHSVETRLCESSIPFGIRQKRMRLTAKTHVLSQDSKTTISMRQQCLPGLLRNLDLPGKSLSTRSSTTGCVAVCCRHLRWLSAPTYTIFTAARQVPSAPTDQGRRSAPCGWTERAGEGSVSRVQPAPSAPTGRWPSGSPPRCHGLHWNRDTPRAPRPRWTWHARHQ